MPKNHLFITLILLTFTLSTTPACKNSPTEQTEQTENTTAQTEPKTEEPTQQPLQEIQKPTEPQKEELAKPLEPPTDANGKYSWSRETLGTLQLGQSMSQVEKTLGKPTTIGDEEFSPATGDYSIYWRYEDKGVGLNFTASEDNTIPKTLGSIAIFAPSKLKTSRGIGLGSKRADVEKAYANTRKKGEENESNKEYVVIGSVFGGLMFHIENNLVTSIFIGAAAE